jgi:alpha-L-fucosidase
MMKILLNFNFFWIFHFAGATLSDVLSSPSSDGMSNKSAIEILGTVVALPSPEQLEWMDFEVGAMITFNLQTICVPCDFANATKQKCQKFGCIPSLSSLQSWKLENLSTDTWLDIAASFHAKYAVLVADHMSGFTLWPTRVHNYSISSTRYTGDVVAEFRASAAARDIAPGIFYSTHFNWILGMNNYIVGWPRTYGGPSLSQSEYEDAAITQLQELADYGPWKELWFDAGINITATPKIPSIVRSLFPNAMCHSCSPFTEANPGKQGTGRGIRWMGNEEGVMPLPSWSAADAIGQPSGNPIGAIFDPPSCDTVLEEHDWFYQDGDINTLRSTCSLINVYLTSVGRASNFILNMAPDTTGKIQDIEVEAYASLGKAIDCLFYTPISNWTNVSVSLINGIAIFPIPPIQCGEPNECNLSLVIEEELSSSGQRISSWIVEALVNSVWISAVSSSMPPEALTGIGHKRIIGLLVPSFDSLRLRVLSAYAAATDPTAPIILRAGAIYNRTSTIQCLPTDCQLVDY